MDFSALEKQYGLPAGILGRMEQTESGGNQFALSNKGAEGYFQFLPGTAKQYNVDPYNLNSAAQGAARYLADLYKQTGSMEKAVAAYNWGPGNLAKFGYQNAPAETKAYVRKVMGDVTQPTTLTMADMNAMWDKAHPTKPTTLTMADMNAMWDKAHPTKPTTQQPNPPADTQNWLQKALGYASAPIDVAAGMLQNAGVGAAGTALGVGKELASGDFGHGLAERTARQFMQQYGYKPASPQGAAALSAVGQAIDRSGIAAIAPDMSLLTPLSTLGRPAATQLTRGAGREAGYAGEAMALGARKLADAAPAPVKAVGRGVTGAVQYLRSPEASYGARGARGMAEQLAREVPIPGAKPMSPEPLPMPREPVQLPALTQGTKPSVMRINTGLESALERRSAALDAERVLAGQRVSSALESVPEGRLTPKAPLFKDLQGFKKSLIDARARAGTGEQRTALKSIIANVSHIRSKSPTPFASLVDLRRSLSEKARFGEPPSGFAALNAQSSAKLSRELNDLLDKYSPEYGVARGEYSEALAAQEPLKSKLLKSIGADESTGGDLTRAIMRSPKNVDRTIEAFGGDVSAVDSAIAQRVTADLHGKSVGAINDYLSEHKPILDKLPEARQTAERIASRAEAADAIQAIQKRAQENYKTALETRQKIMNQQADVYTTQQRAYLASHELSSKYHARFAKMETLPPEQLPGELRSVLSQMQSDGLITAEKYKSALQEVSAFEKSIKVQQGVRKMVTAGGVLGFLHYAINRKAWDIIMRSTR